MEVRTLAVYIFLSILKASVQECFKAQIQDSNNKIKTTWDTIKLNTGKKTAKNYENIYLVINNDKIENALEIANSFAEHYEGVAHGLTPYIVVSGLTKNLLPGISYHKYFKNFYIKHTDKFLFSQVREGETIPYLVRIVNPTLHQQCNGILVSKNLVLTSAYCVNGSTPVSLYLGYSQDPRIDSLRVKENGQDFTSSDFIIHNNFKQPYAMKDYYEHDIAVVKLPRNAVLSDKVYEANLQGMSMEITFPEAAKLITFYRNKLKIVDANIQSGAVCSSEINTEFEAAYYQVGQHGCASLPADFGGYDHYGSPLVIGDNVIGFTTNNPSGKDNPALFVSITDFQIWIDFQVENNLPYPESASCCIVGWFVLISALQIIIIMFN